MNIIYIALLITVIFALAFILNGLAYLIADKLGWFDQPLVKDHWWDKYIDKMWIWYNNEREKLDSK